MSFLSRGKRTMTMRSLAVIGLCLVGVPLSTAFVSQSNSLAQTSTPGSSGLPGRVHPAFVNAPSTSRPGFTSDRSQSSTELNMFMGSDGGVLGIGTPELFTILLVGYFVLGPSDLYKLVKEIGKFVQNFRTFTTEATSTLENSLESQLQLEEIRKAQRELNDAFNFRRSINVEADSDPFEVNAQSPRPDFLEEAPVGAVAAAAATTATEEGVAPVKKKIRRRRVKKKKVEPIAEETEEEFVVPDDIASSLNQGPVQNDIPSDLSFEDETMTEAEEKAAQAMREANEELRREAMEEEAAELRKERMERLQGAGMGSGDTAAAEDPAEAEAAAARFQSQLTDTWNDTILSKEDELSPLANIMERLALLEDEKQAADERLQEEFRLREENEEQFYREKRKLLEEAAAQVQAEAYAVNGDQTGAAENKDVATKI